MHAAQRQKRIAALIEERGAAEVSELSSLFKVSEVTIRSDLRLLEQEGRIKRTFGGALMNESAGVPFQDLKDLLSDKKTAIAKAAMDLIEEGDSLFLDASSTTWHLALQLRDKADLTVISNSIPVFEQFKQYATGTLIGIPGTLNPYSQSFVGPMAEQTVMSLQAGKAFIAPKSIVPEGLRDNNVLDATLRRRMMESASETIVLADHSKFTGSRKLFGIAELDAVSTIVTDKLPDEPFLRLIRDKNIRLIVAAE
ncbi:MAG: DeoR/GlpR transcriptional regulator [Paenibacillaceae bacterium]|nr:DeoR/GlpR transcriptional regulator [Paenibacillaceae bacterium]